MTRTKPSGVMVALLAVISVALVAIAVVMVIKIADRPWKEGEERGAAREEFETQAGYYCTLGGVVPGMTGLDDPAYKNCVDREAKTDLDAWDRDHPDLAPPQ